MVLFTDGLTETMNRDAEQFGHERLFETVTQAGMREAEYVLWKLDRAAAAFRGNEPQADDLTMVSFKVTA